jgi:hypothetical protein
MQKVDQTLSVLKGEILEMQRNVNMAQHCHVYPTEMEEKSAVVFTGLKKCKLVPALNQLSTKP